MDRIVYETSEIKVGDLIAYPGKLPWGQERNARDALKVSRIEDGFVRGLRVEPEDWERDIEFSVYPQQLSDNGVLLKDAAPGLDSSSATAEATAAGNEAEAGAA